MYTELKQLIIGPDWQEENPANDGPTLPVHEFPPFGDFIKDDGENLDETDDNSPHKPTPEDNSTQGNNSPDTHSKQFLTYIFSITMAEKLPPSNQNNLLSKALGIRTVEDEIKHHEEHLANLESDFYYQKLINEFGFTRLKARQRINQLVTEKQKIIANLQTRNKSDSFLDATDQNLQD